MTSYVGKIPDHALEDDNIKWLVISPHIHNKTVVGYYINFHENLNESARFDNWYQTLEQAIDHGKDYGIDKDDWRLLDSK